MRSEELTHVHRENLPEQWKFQNKKLICNCLLVLTLIWRFWKLACLRQLWKPIQLHVPQRKLEDCTCSELSINCLKPIVRWFYSNIPIIIVPVTLDEQRGGCPKVLWNTVQRLPVELPSNWMVAQFLSVWIIPTIRWIHLIRSELSIMFNLTIR